MSTTTSPAPTLVQLTAALPNGATHVSITLQDGSVASKPAGYVYQLVKVAPASTLNGVTIPGSQQLIGPESYLAAASPTADSAGAQAIYNSIINPPAPVYPLSAFKAAVQVWLDAYAQSHGYDDITTMCSYQGDPNATYAADATAAIKLRSDTWSALFTAIPSTGSTQTPAAYVATLKS